MRALGDYLGVKVHICVGETSVHEDQRILLAGVHVVVGTYGGVFDMLRRQVMKIGESGSLKMPHKVNRVDFDNSEGNLGTTNAVLDLLSMTLPIEGISHLEDIWKNYT